MDLDRFVAAQDEGGTLDAALAEIAAGRKTTHWMWFVFPQIAGLGLSPTAVRYAVPDLDAAREYAADPVLGERLRRAARAAVDSPAAHAEDLLGGIDAVKLRSSMTLFARAVPGEAVFRAVLDRFFGGQEDPATLERL